MIRTHHLRLVPRFLANRLRELHPFEVQAVLLNGCTLRCTYCCCPSVSVPMMTTAQWVATIRGLRSHGMMRIKFQGGEPTIRADFRELCAESRRLGVITAATTNGQHIPDQPSLLDDLDEIVFSLDAVTPEINDRVRGRGTHALVVRAMELAAERNLRMYVSMVVSRDNVHEVEAMLDFCEARGAGMHAQPIVFGRQYYDDRARAFALGNEEIRELHARLAAWKRQGRALMFSAATYDGVRRWDDYDALTQTCEGDSGCVAGEYYVHIEANGDVHPCLQHGATGFAPKNVLRDGLDEALRHVRHHNCADCFSAYLNERKALFGLRPATLVELARRG